MWYLWQELRFFGIPPSVRYVCHLLWRAVLMRLYEAHKMLVLWREYPWAFAEQPAQRMCTW
jgi:hypothetical protein